MLLLVGRLSIFLHLFFLKIEIKIILNARYLLNYIRYEFIEMKQMENYCFFIQLSEHFVNNTQKQKEK